MLLNRSILHSAGTDGDGFNRAQLELLGIKWPPSKGWLNNLIGTYIADETWNKVMALKGVNKRVDRKLILNDQMNLI